MARSNILAHKSIHVSMEIIQGIQTHIDLHFHLYSPPPPTKLIKTENRGYEAHLGCGGSVLQRKWKENEVIFGLSTLPW